MTGPSFNPGARKTLEIVKSDGSIFGVAKPKNHGGWTLTKTEGNYIPTATDVHNSQIIEIGKGCLESYLSGFRERLTIRESNP